jgi:hypothetical protein
MKECPMGSRDYNQWAQRLELIRRCAVTLLWIIIIASIFMFLVKHVITNPSINDDKVKLQIFEQKDTVVESRISYEKLNEEISAALIKPRDVALDSASEGLDNWVEEIMGRVDPDFLDWYFGYWTQQKMQLASIYNNAFHLVYKKHPSAEEKIHEEIVREFQKRVLQQNISQLELETIAQQAMNQYVETLRHELSLIAIRYKIPKAEWDRYLDDITILSKTFEGRRTVPLTLKAIVSYSSTIMVSRQMRFIAGSIERKAGTQVGTEAVSMGVVIPSACVFGRATMKVMEKFLTPVVVVAILAWDVLDHHRMEAEYRPILKENIRKYFCTVKETILNDEESGILATILDIEKNVLDAVQLETRQ